MKILITGSSGLIGSAVAQDLIAHGNSVVTFDAEQGDDICDIQAVTKVVQGCDAVIHSAAMLGFPDQADSDIFDVNVKGTWNVVSAAAKAGVKRLVYLSSVNVLGIFKGERHPDYFPINDDHPKYPLTAYGTGKLMCEEMCRAFTNATDMTCIALRPPSVWPPERYEQVRAHLQDNPDSETHNWEYGAFIDIRDMSAACIAALDAEVSGFEAMLVCAPDILGSENARDLANALCPNTKWQGGPEYERDPFRALVDCRKAHEILNWTPQHSWAERGN